MAEMEALAAQKSLTAVQPSHTEPQRERRILLVEDQKNVQDMMMSMLERLGYEAFCCDDGLEALELVREEPEAFDLVITDHNMPKMTGLEMIQQISLSYPRHPIHPPFRL